MHKGSSFGTPSTLLWIATAIAIGVGCEQNDGENSDAGTQDLHRVEDAGGREAGEDAAGREDAGKPEDAGGPEPAEDAGGLEDAGEREDAHVEGGDDAGPSEDGGTGVEHDAGAGGSDGGSRGPVGPDTLSACGPDACNPATQQGCAPGLTCFAVWAPGGFYDLVGTRCGSPTSESCPGLDGPETCPATSSCYRLVETAGYCQPLCDASDPNSCGAGGWCNSDWGGCGGSTWGICDTLAGPP